MKLVKGLTSWIQVPRINKNNYIELESSSIDLQVNRYSKTYHQRFTHTQSISLLFKRFPTKNSFVEYSSLDSIHTLSTAIIIQSLSTPKIRKSELTLSIHLRFGLTIGLLPPGLFILSLISVQPFLLILVKKHVHLKFIINVINSCVVSSSSFTSKASLFKIVCIYIYILIIYIYN